MKRAEFTLNFFCGKSPMRIKIYDDSEYSKRVSDFKKNILLVKEFSHACTFIDEGIRVTVVNGKYVEENSEELKSELLSAWEGYTSDIFTLLLETLKTIQR